MEKALFDWPIVLQYDAKAKCRLISRKFFGHEVFSADRSLNQPKATRVCIRSINQSNRLISVRFLFLFVRAFSFQGQTKIALYEESFSPVEGSLAYLSNPSISFQNVTIRTCTSAGCWLELSSKGTMFLSYKRTLKLTWLEG